MKVIRKERDEGFLKSFDAVCKKYGVIPVLEWRIVNPQYYTASLSYEKDWNAGQEEADRFNSIYLKIIDVGKISPAYGDCLCEVFQNLIIDVSSIWEWTEDVKISESFTHADLIAVFGEENEGRFYRTSFI